MTHFAIYNADLAFVGIFETQDKATSYIQALPGATMREIEVIPGTLIHHSTFAWSMYEVCLNGDITAWVQAGYPWSALVEVAVCFGVTHCDPERCIITEHNSYTKGHGKDKQNSPATFAISPLMAEILSYLTPENKDLCAHLLEGVEEYATIDEVRRDNPPTPMDAQTIRDQAETIWHEHRNWMFLEETGATMSIQRLISRHRQTQDPVEALFWTFVLSMWGGRACFDPYGLYECITQHKFDKFWADLQAVRSLLGGQ